MGVMISKLHTKRKETPFKLDFGRKWNSENNKLNDHLPYDRQVPLEKKKTAVYIKKNKISEITDFIGMDKEWTSHACGLKERMAFH